MSLHLRHMVRQQGYTIMVTTGATLKGLLQVVPGLEAQETVRDRK